MGNRFNPEVGCLLESSLASLRTILIEPNGTGVPTIINPIYGETAAYGGSTGTIVVTLKGQAPQPTAAFSRLTLNAAPANNSSFGVQIQSVVNNAYPTSTCVITLTMFNTTTGTPANIAANANNLINVELVWDRAVFHGSTTID